MVWETEWGRGAERERKGKGRSQSALQTRSDRRKEAAERKRETKSKNIVQTGKTLGIISWRYLMLIMFYI